MQLIAGKLNVERLTIRDFDGDIPEEDVRIWLTKPMTVFDLRAKVSKRLASLVDLPSEARELVSVGQPK